MTSPSPTDRHPEGPGPPPTRPSPRPAALVLVIGTATEVGKTWVGGRTLAALRTMGVAVAARKPAQSHDPDDGEPLDAEVLGAATGEPAEAVCPSSRTYPVPMAPPMAADALGADPPTIDQLVAELTWADPPPDLGWVETVGGPRSPIASDGDAVDLDGRLAPDLVVLVADAGLGTVNAVRLSIAPFAHRSVLVLLNRYVPDDDLHRRNLAWLRDVEGLHVFTECDELAAHLTSRL